MTSFIYAELDVVIVFSFRPDQLVPRADQPILEIPAATVRRSAGRHLLYQNSFVIGFC